MQPAASYESQPSVSNCPSLCRAPQRSLQASVAPTAPFTAAEVQRAGSWRSPGFLARYMAPMDNERSEGKQVG